MKRKYKIIAISLVILLILSVPGYYISSTFSSIPKMFKLNNNLVSEGYYTAEFEFKMLGLAYYLDKGHYITAFIKINQLRNQLKSKQGLIKIPKFANKKEELEFYLNLQNPKTGAFMDDSYPYFTYLEPTMNVLDKLEGLAKETGQPLKFKYPLEFLNQIDTAEELKAYLDDLSSVGWIGSKFKPTFILAAKMTGYDELETQNLYTFSSEWKQALIKWFYDNQDSKTGFWGSKLRSTGELLNSGDLGPTYSIVEHLFLDNHGNNLHPEFPLRYKDEMFSTALKKLAEPVPEDANLDEIHDWSIVSYQGTKLLTDYLWKTASKENKNNAGKVIENIVKTKFEKFYVKERGGFSLYPGVDEPDLDGTGGVVHLLDVIGAFDRDTQTLLWGSSEETIVDSVAYKVSELKENDLNSIKNADGINSIRVYTEDPEQNSYLSNVDCIIYPKDTSVLDVMDLLPKITQWVKTTPQSMGIWTPKERVEQELSNLNIKPVKVSGKEVPIQLLNSLLKKDRRLVIIGFDVLQIPRYEVEVTLN